MIQIEQTLISDEILEKHFVCDLKSCKGACCVEGDGGAPLEKEELNILEEIFPKIKSRLRPEALEAIQEKGLFVENKDGSYETTLVNNKACVFVTYNEQNIAQCGIEKAYKEGVISWKKPISCHLYPIRVLEMRKIIGLNYHQWSICDPACSLGNKLKVPVYAFAKEALIRKFGSDFYQKLVQYAEGEKD
jgi:hypothetical protein